jgi:5-methylcytosine-specific restriction endonuclease McrA
MKSSRPLPLCVNCDRPLGQGGSLLYCSDACSQEASYVRYYRLALSDGRWRKPEVQEAIRIRGVVVMNGGYPRSERTLSPQLRTFVLERDGHTCQSCGGRGTQVDHIRMRGVNRNLNHPLNLQVLCAACHREKTLSDIRLISHRDDPELWSKLHAKSTELERRVRAEPAERVCDDEGEWPLVWRKLQAERREQLPRGRPSVRRGHLRLVK